MARDREVSGSYTMKGSIFVITETHFSIQTQVTTKLHGTSTRGCNNNVMFRADQFSLFLPSSYAGHVNLAGESLDGPG